MELYLKQRVLSKQDENDIWDSEGACVYRLSGRLFNAGAKLRLLDRQGRELYYIEEAFFSILATFTLYHGQQVRAKVKQKLSLLRPKLTIESGDNLCIRGNIWGMSVELVSGGVPFATLTKAWQDEAIYQLTVPDPEKAPLALALTVAIDRFIHGGGG